MQTDAWIAVFLTAPFMFTEFEKTGEESIVACLNVPPQYSPGGTQRNYEKY
jgi:hypothetical protein